MNYAIPALLFSGISMFFNGYTIRYLNISKLIRNFHNHPDKDCNIKAQILNFRLRLKYIKWITVMLNVSVTIFNAGDTF